jgi:hypothetical protein
MRPVKVTKIFFFLNQINVLMTQTERKQTTTIENRSNEKGNPSEKLFVDMNYEARRLKVWR